MNSAEHQQALGQSEAFLELQERISRAAKTDRSVIFIGERGTGKELAASRLHLLSARWNLPYVTLNCASLSPTLIESELFGHEAGAFTGATRQRKGRFEMADGGSLFLDEVANIPMTVQDKILRTVEYGQMERVGSSTTLTVDARLIAATNVDLRALAREGKFRQDLLDRLSFEVIVLPPLRARCEDILPLAEHFARRMAAELGLAEAPVMSERAQEALLAHPWPGNIRELKNVIERMVYRTEGSIIHDIVFDPFESAYMPESLPCDEPIETNEGELESRSKKLRTQLSEFRSRFSDFKSQVFRHEKPEGKEDGTAETPATGLKQSQNGGDIEELPLEEEVRSLELRRIRQALETARFNQRKAAEMLGLTYHQFRGYYRKYQKDLS